MVTEDESTCPHCGGELKFYDMVRRMVRTKGGKKRHVKMRRLRCKGCRHVHRETPDYIYPYMQYDAEIIRGVLEGFITPETIGFEDYPCEMTMLRWISRKTQLLL